MKKVLLTVVLFAGFGLAASAQCGDNASPISSSCFNGCVSVIRPLTGFLEIDAGNAGRQKPTADEYAEAQSLLDAYCARTNSVSSAEGSLVGDEPVLLD
jgi:hypothetical protein